MPCPTPKSLFFLLRHHRASSLLLLLSPRSTSTLAHNCHPCPHSSSSSNVDLLRKQEEQRQALQNPYDLMKEDPIQVCSDLWVRCFGRPADAPPLPNLTGFLKKFDLWVLAYQRACAHHTGSFPRRGAIHLPHLRSLLALQSSVLASPRRPYPWGAST
ncbi:hypothetical protein B296_00058521, partial [Ensete ventricosum]